MRSITYEQFYEENKDYTTDICKECNSKLELVLKKYEIEIDMRTLIIEDFPQLECQSCGKKFLSEHSKKIVEVTKRLFQNHEILIKDILFARK